VRIVRVRLHLVRLPLVHGFETSSHRKDHLEHVLVQVTDEGGAEGWGEIASPSDPYYGADTTETSWHVAERYLVPAVLGREWATPADGAAAWARVRGHEFARAGFDMALWVLAAAADGVPLAGLLGGTRSEVVAGVSLGIEPTINDLLAAVAAQTGASGYRRVKLKIAPGWDVAPVRAVRDAFPALDLQVDANGAYPADEESFAVLRALEPYGLTMIEQPFAPRDLVSHAALQASTDTPICLYESIVTVDDIRTMLALRAGRVVNVKVSRMGGLGAAVAAHDLCVAEGVPVWCGGMHEFGVGRLVNVALSALPGFTLPSDVSASAKYYTRDVVVPEVVARDGLVAVPTAAGLGADVDVAWVAENAIRTLDRRWDG
jgi:O-succinylbenzoate synthase